MNNVETHNIKRNVSGEGTSSQNTEIIEVISFKKDTKEQKTSLFTRLCYWSYEKESNFQTKTEKKAKSSPSFRFHVSLSL